MTTLTIDSSDYVEAPEGINSLKFSDEKQQANFELGVTMAIHSWDALETAVANGWGGPQSEEKRDWISSIVIGLFEERVVDVQLVEDTILNAMVDEFDVNVEDDSSLPVAANVIKFYRNCAEQDYTEVREVYERWQQRAQERAARRQQQQHVQIQEDPSNPDASDEDQDEDNEEVPQLATEVVAVVEDVEMEDAPQGPVIDDDGFELVQKKGRRRR